MKYKILISILATVLIAGCTIPGLEGVVPTSVGGAGGLEITEFTAEPSPIYSGSKLRITMVVENQGGTTVSNTSSLVYLTGSNVDFSGDETYWRPSTSGDKPYQYFNKNMKPADVVKGTPADSKTFTWTLTAPNISAGQTRTDTFYGRTYCDYSTAVNGNVWIYTEGEANAAKASGRATNKASFTSTSGPVGLNVKVSPDPVIYYDTGETFSLYITVSNLATGTIYLKGKSYSSGIPTLTETDYNQVVVSVGYDNSKLTLSNSADCTGQQELPAGKSTTLVCDFTVASAPPTFQSYPLTVTADYGYYTERTASVTVQGK
jgi:hypothetical protein